MGIRFQSIGNNDVCVTGYAARLPGAADAREAWHVLEKGQCVVGEVPQDRWSDHRFLSPGQSLPGHSYTRRAGCLDSAFDFDARYFGISPREAEQMDPQQRLLLEVTASAFEHAGIDPARLHRDRTGVYVGAASLDHSHLMLQDPSVGSGRFMLGNTGSILANRIAHHWDFHGPSMTIDTACSSALVALDQARRAISDGTIDLAVVGGVNLLLSPMPFVGFSQAGMLSPTGLCRAFGAEADGYVRGEGAIVFVLERAVSAVAAGRPVRSILASSAVNTAGRTADIAAPSAERQADLMRAVRTAAGVDPDAITFVEAHGTGTPVGDPIEASAIGKVYGRNRKSPLPIGSSKSNFGHLEPAAGLVGLLKAQLALDHAFLPPTLHCETANPDIDFGDLNIELTVSGRDLPGDEPVIAAINSFGFGGVNAHALLVSPAKAQPARAIRPQNETETHALPPSLLISAATETSLRQLACSWRDIAAESRHMPALVATANWRRAMHRYRLCVAAGDVRTLQSELSRWLDTPRELAPGADAETLLDAAPVGFVFSGNGALWAGAGLHLLETDEVFRASFDDLAAGFVELGLPDIRQTIADPELETRASDAEIAQPLTFAIQIALTDSLAAAGVFPDAVLGHSLGEVAAAIASGRLSRPDGQRIIATRSRAFAPLRGTGSMAALACSRDRVETLISETGLGVEISAENAPESVTASGPKAELQSLLKAARRARIAGRLLAVDYPYHASPVDDLREVLMGDLADISGRKGEATYYSGWRGRRHDAPLEAEYWWCNARAPVEFRSAVTAMARDGIRVFVEISPRTVLRTYLRDTLAEFASATSVLESIDRNRAEARTPAAMARAVLAAGGKVDREKVLGPERPAIDGLPPYPFERETYRLDTSNGVDVYGQRARHPLMGGRLLPDGDTWQGEILLGRIPWLADHKVAGRILLPAMAMLEIFVAAGIEIAGNPSVELRDIEFLQPLEVPEKDALALRVIHEASARRLKLETGGAGAWRTVAVARLFTGAGTLPERSALPPRDRMSDATSLYERLSANGLDYGPAFARLRGIASDGETAFARLEAPEPGSGFLFDARAADAALHPAALLLDNDDGLRIPARIDRARFIGAGQIATSRVKRSGGGGESLAFDVMMGDGDGTPVLALSGLRLRRLETSPRGPQAFWDERLVPLAGTGSSALYNALRSRFSDDQTEPSDADILRSAFGGRLAWDVVAQGDRTDPRFIVASKWLVAAGWAKAAETGEVQLADECPWPELDTLLAMLPGAAPDAAHVLKAVLDAITGRSPERVSVLPDVLRSLTDALDSAPDGIGRLALCGEIDRNLLFRACRKAAHVTVLAETPEALERLKARLGTSRATRFATLDQPELASDADLLLLAGATQTFSDDALMRLSGIVAPGGMVLAVEERDDIFALMTGRHTRPKATEALAGALRRSGLEVETSLSRDAESLRIFLARRTNENLAAPPCLTIHGVTSLADALRHAASEGEGGGEVHALCGSLEDGADGPASLFMDLPETTKPLWLVVEGTTRWAELTGWRRSVVNETGRDLRLLCHEARAKPDEIVALIAGSREQEVLLTDQGAFAPRVVPVDPLAQVPGPRRLTVAGRGAAWENLSWVAQDGMDLADDAVEIDVAATGLNFRDVMWAQGLLPPEALEGGFAGPGLGMECAGIVRRAGARSGFKPGDRVIALAPHAMASRVVTSAKAARHAPDGVDLAIAAGIPVAYLTADYALNEVARLAAGETVLIHGAAGGVGLAALQVALKAGARVIATAGSPAKRRFIEAMGAEAVFDSRALHFDEDVRQATQGRGVDVALNSLAGEALERSLSCLAPFGRFIELGKRDLYENSLVALRAMRQNVSLHVVDVDQLMAHRPDAAERCLTRLATALAEQSLTPLPTQTYAAEDVGEAMRAMQQAAHIGKIVIRAPVQPASDTPHRGARPIRGGWLVTGGTSGFGLEVAHWLAAQGAECLWLVSRSGRVAEGALEDIEVPVHVIAADVTDPAAMAQALEKMRQDDIAIRGIVHGAAIFDDAPLAELDQARIAAIQGPKVTGAAILDKLAGDLPLDHFWLFSSVAARFGNPAQAPYVAANRALEALAEARVEAGLPALAIAWGPIGDAGLLARSDAVRQAIERRIIPMAADEALAKLATVLASGYSGPSVTIAPVAWGRLASSLPVLSGALFDLVPCDPDRDEAAQLDLAELLREKGPTETRKVLTRILIDEAAQLLQAAPADIDPHAPLQYLGFDSLMAMNLRLAAEERLNITFPVMAASEDLTLGALVDRIVESADSTTEDAEIPSVVAEMAAKHVSMPDQTNRKTAELASAVAETIEAE